MRGLRLFKVGIRNDEGVAKNRVLTQMGNQNGDIGTRRQKLWPKAQYDIR